MKVYIAYEIDHDKVGDYGIEILGVFSNRPAANALADRREREYLEEHSIDPQSEEYLDLPMTWDVDEYDVLDEAPFEPQMAVDFTDRVQA